jgi:Holliday junction resolvase
MTTEAVLQTNIIRELQKHGCLCYKVKSIGNAGLPDLMIIRDRKTMFIEVKNPKGTGKVSRLQEYEIRRIQAAGIPATIANSVDQALQQAVQAGIINP